MNNKRKGLGKGLGAILTGADDDVLEYEENRNKSFSDVNSISIDFIETNPYQPRTEFDELALVELAESIKNLGIIQPITIRKIGAEKYQLISGERRLRASKMAGLKEIPAYVRDVEDSSMLELAIVENLQRENLNPMEIAFSFQQLMDENKLTQEKLSERVSKSRSAVANYLRLLKLPFEIQAGLKDEKISMGHARALINIPDSKTQIRIFHKILHNGLSVRAVEDLVRNLSKSKSKTAHDDDDFEFAGVIEKIVDFFNSNVEIKKGKEGGGKISISFKDHDDLNRILNKIG